MLARNPQEMATAQQNLITWVERRLQLLGLELTEANENLAKAKIAHWKTGPWQRLVNLAKGRIAYFEKIKAALDAGFCIIPDFPIQVFAIRTAHDNPRANAVQRSWAAPVPDQQSEAPVLGAGEYKSPEALVERSDHTRDVPSHDGKTMRKETTHYAHATEFQDVDFPLRIVRPQILDDTTRAMAMKIFDELGVLPAGRAPVQRLPAGDPMVVGRIIRREGARRFAVSFLVTWWVDSRALR